MPQLSLQLQQFLTLLLLLILGKATAYIYLSWWQIIDIFLVSIFIEHIFIYLKQKRLEYFSFSALSTAIGIVLMLFSPHMYIYLIVIFLAFLQKHFLLYQKRHLFNPSNFALIAGLLLFYKDAHLLLGQLGTQQWLSVIVILLSIFVLFRAKRWLIPLVFSIVYVFISYAVISRFDPVVTLDTILLRFYSVSFIVFIVFMLTDPKTTPKRGIFQILFAISIACISTFLDYHNGFRVQHVFMALFFTSPVAVMIESFKKKIKRRWLLIFFTLIILSIGAIIYIELQAPYYFQMDK